ncbi:maestro heat-like repeat family member 5 [Grus japonensis]|uniref:Maestro heat-like repeat family member 5 n=1 Tax=Grus japonensis TaxID=30415 RepID=A0ABC9X2P9_GRUJA
MSRNACNRIIRYLVELLRRKETRWELPAMAFLVELVACPGIKGDRTLQLILRYLQSQRNAVPAAKAHSATAGCHHGEVVGMTLSVLSKVVQNVDVPIASPIALQLAEALRPLFDKESSYVQLLSIHFFRDVMGFVAEAGKKPLEPHVQQSLFPLLYHLHDENQRVAEASRETLLQATTFLKKRKLTWLLKRQQTWEVGECLLTEPSSRADEYLLQSLL